MVKPTPETALLTRLLGAQPSESLITLRREIRRDLDVARSDAQRLEAELRQVEDELANRDGQSELPLRSVEEPTTLPLKKAIVWILDNDTSRIWDREELLAELTSRGWGPGGDNPRNTFTSRLRDLEKELAISRLGRDLFRSVWFVDEEEVPGM